MVIVVCSVGSIVFMRDFIVDFNVIGRELVDKENDIEDNSGSFKLVGFLCRRYEGFFYFVKVVLFVGIVVGFFEGVVCNLFCW